MEETPKEKEATALAVNKRTYSVSVPPGPIHIFFLYGTCRVHAVKRASPLWGVMKKGETLMSVNGKPVTPTTVFDVIKAADDGTSKREFVFQRTSPQVGRLSKPAAEPSSINTRPDSPAEPPLIDFTVPKEEEATVVAPEAEGSPPEALAEEAPPLPPPAKSWFGRAEPEPESEEAERPPPPARSWSFWRAEPEPEEAEQPPPLSPFSALRAERERELKTLASP